MSPRGTTIGRRLGAELIGTWGIVTVVVGSGIMAERLSGDVGVQLLANTVATAGGLVLFITLFAPVSGAQFNPVVSIVQWIAGRFEGRNVLPFVIAQVLGACLGAMTANAMFGLDVVNVSDKVRDGGPIVAGEVVATAVLVLLIEGFVRSDRAGLIPCMVAAWITAVGLVAAATVFPAPSTQE